MTVGVHNFFYYDEKVIDLGKLRAEAYKVARGDERNKPMIAIIHYHDSEEECLGKRHEKYWYEGNEEEGEVLHRKYKAVMAHMEEDIR